MSYKLDLYVCLFIKSTLPFKGFNTATQSSVNASVLSLLLHSPTIIFLRIFQHLHTFYMAYQLYPSFYPINVWCKTQIMKLLAR